MKAYHVCVRARARVRQRPPPGACARVRAAIEKANKAEQTEQQQMERICPKSSFFLSFFLSFSHSRFLVFFPGKRDCKQEDREAQQRTGQRPQIPRPATRTHARTHARTCARTSTEREKKGELIDKMQSGKGLEGKKHIVEFSVCRPLVT